jgi:hypothetical protein
MRSFTDRNVSEWTTALFHLLDRYKPNKTPPYLGAFYCLSNKGVQAPHFYDTSRLTTESPAIP